MSKPSKPWTALPVTLRVLALVAATRAESLVVADPACRAIVDPSAGSCSAIAPCLAAMPSTCAVKALTLLPGVTYSGPQNTNIAINGTAAVSITGPAAPAPLRVGPDGAAEPVTGAGVPAASAVATIDGEGTRWLFSVADTASLTLRDVALVRGRGGQFEETKGRLVNVGGAVLIQGAARFNATGVLFDSHTAAVQAGSKFANGGAVFSSSEGAAALHGCGQRRLRCGAGRATA